MKSRWLLAPVIALATAVLLVRADDPVVRAPRAASTTDRKDEGKIDPKATIEDAAIRQERLSREFREFEQKLLRLAQRMASSSKPEDREKAVTIKKALEKASTEGVDTKFDKLVATLKSTKAVTISDLASVMERNKELASDLRSILNILLTDNRDEELRRERERIQELLKKLNEVIRAQQTVRAWNERGTMERDQLGREQKNVSDATRDLARAMGKADGKDGTKERGESKGEGKKGPGGKAEGKNDTKESKGDNKNANAGKGPENKGTENGKPTDDKDGKAGSKGGDSKDGDKEAKGGAKGGDEKNGEKGGEKAGGKGADDQENKGGGKGGDGKEGDKESKGDGKGSDGKEGDKDGKGGSKGGEGKEGDKDGKGGSKGGEGKEGEKGGNKSGGKGADDQGAKGGMKPGAGEGEKGGAKGGEGSKGGEKGGDGSEKPAGGKGGESGGEKGGEKGGGKGGEGSKGGEQGGSKGEGSKGGEQGGEQGGEKKGGDKAASKTAGENKGEGKGSDVRKKPEEKDPSKKGEQGNSKGGQQQGGNQGGQQQQGGSKGGGQQQGGGQQGGGGGGGGQQDSEQEQSRKKVADANQDQRQAEEKIEKAKNDEAGEKQDDAIAKLKEAQKKLEELLRQLREEEIERMLAALQQRCERMLAMQKEVREGTSGVKKAIEGNADKKPSRTEDQRSLQLADREDEIVREAGKAIQMLEAEGSAVAFPEVFTQIRSDMINVSKRLRKTDVGLVTLAIEDDIITTLQEMIEALKQAQKQQQAKKQQGGGGGGGKDRDQPLIDLVQELKMIRAMQLRVNQRTKLYGEEYKGVEQAPIATAGMKPEEKEKADMIHKEVRNLAERELKIYKVTNDIARGKNEPLPK